MHVVFFYLFCNVLFLVISIIIRLDRIIGACIIIKIVNFEDRIQPNKEHGDWSFDEVPLNIKCGWQRKWEP